MTRRTFVSATAAGASALGTAKRPAILGAVKARTARWPSWPVLDKTEEEALLASLRSGAWYRGSGKRVAAFESAYASLTGAKGCLGTANGTSALYTVLASIGISAGD